MNGARDAPDGTISERWYLMSKKMDKDISKQDFDLKRSCLWGAVSNERERFEYAALKKVRRAC